MFRIVIPLALATTLALPGLARAQRLIPQEMNPELYTLVVEAESAEETNSWWHPFLQEHVLDNYCFDLLTLETAERTQIGDQAKVLDFGGKAQLVQLIVLPPGAETKWHGYGWEGEALFFVIEGEGETEYKAVSGGLPSNKYTWKTNTLFAIPVDHRVRHKNTSSDATRILAVVGYGINLYPYVREELRYQTENPAEGPEERAATLARATYPGHYVEDLRNHQVHLREARGNRTAFFNLLSTVGHRTHQNVHISELFKEKASAHKHSGEPMFYILKGAGYDIWSDAEDLEAYYAEVESGEAQKAPYKVGTICGVPPGPHWHHHFSTHPTEPLRYLAINPRRQFDEKPRE